MKPKIWKDLLNNNYPTTLYIGDAFGVKGETITGSVGFTRDYNINSTEEFYDLLEDNPYLKGRIEPSNYNYYTNMGARATKEIAQLLSIYKKDFDIKFSTNVTFDDIKQGNAIYVGPLHNHNKFLPFFNDAVPHIELDSRKIQIKDHPDLKDKMMKVSTSGKDSDIALVAKIPGPMGTEQLLFFSNHDIGVSATINLFTNKDSLETFAQEHLSNSKYFVAIYKALGKERTSLDLKKILVIPIAIN